MTEAEIDEALDAIFDGMSEAECDALLIQAEDGMNEALRARFDAVLRQPEFDHDAMDMIMLEALQNVL